MKSILIFIDGTICDTRHRHHLFNLPNEFNKLEHIINDKAVPNSVKTIKDLAKRYNIIYMGARPNSTTQATKKWLYKEGFPMGEIYLAETQDDRLRITNQLKNKYDFIAGIGDRFDDNELHLNLGCLSIILKEFEGEWNHVCEYIRTFERKLKIKQNEHHLKGKVEGLARVLPKLYQKYGNEMWDVYFTAVLKMAEESREERRQEDLKSFEKYQLNPENLKDIATWETLTREEYWEINESYGLQEIEFLESKTNRFVMKVTKCKYAEFWKEHKLPEFGYQIHCHTDIAWWDRPAWNPKVRFEQPQTLMKGDEFCLFIQFIPPDE
jgi:hypothetical protein